MSSMRSRSTRSSARRQPTPLGLEALEDRAVPAIAIQIDYSFDTGGFFNDPVRRAILQQAANDVAARLDTFLPAITPSGGNTWSATFFHPSTGQQATIAMIEAASGSVEYRRYLARVITRPVVYSAYVYHQPSQS